MPIGTGTAILAGAGISGASSLAGGKKGASAATDAAGLQAASAQRAIDFQREVFNRIQGNIQPFLDFGTGAIPSFQGAIPGLTAPIDTSLPQWSPTQAQLEQTPGYQFTLSQGLRAAQNQLTAGGLGRGGPSQQGAINYATNLASTTYQQQFSNYLSQVQNLMASRSQELQQRGQQYNMLAGPVNTGLQAAAAGAGAAVPISGQIAQNIQNVGAAQASGVVGSANALTGGLTGVGNAASNAANLFALTRTAGNDPGFTGNAPVSGASTPIVGVDYPYPTG
jgi:hypothetical protein